LQGDNNSFREGDPRYLAAEVLHEKKLSKAADIFALGATILELVRNTSFTRKAQLMASRLQDCTVKVVILMLII
jgi:hypothetical protein